MWVRDTVTYKTEVHLPIDVQQATSPMFLLEITHHTDAPKLTYSPTQFLRCQLSIDKQNKTQQMADVTATRFESRFRYFTQTNRLKHQKHCGKITFLTGVEH